MGITIVKHKRSELLERFQQMKRDRIPIIGGGAGTGTSAKGEEAGDIDLIMMAEAGADLLVAHFGTTIGGAIGATVARPLATCAELLDKWAEAALSVRKDIIVIGHGGPLGNPEDAASYPEDAASLFKQSRHCAGFYGASSMERLPVETALASRTKEFKALRF